MKSLKDFGPSCFKPD